jgi:hypothetical protein
MKQFGFFAAFGAALIFLSCGVSKAEFESLKAERDRLLTENAFLKTELGKYDERFTALVGQALANKKADAARIAPEAGEAVPVEALPPEAVEPVEAASIESGAAQETPEDAESIADRLGFDNQAALSAALVDVAEANRLLSNGGEQLTPETYYIIRPAYYNRAGDGKMYLNSAPADGAASVTISARSSSGLKKWDSLSVLARARRVGDAVDFSLVEWQRK